MSPTPRDQGPVTPVLPMDVIYDIIGELAQSSLEVFEHEPVVVATLYSLCLVSRDINTWSTPHLYRCISTRGNFGLFSLFGSPLPERARIRSLFFAKYSGLYIESKLQFIRIVAPTLERLMVYEIGHDVVRAMIETSVVRLPALHSFVYADWTQKALRPTDMISQLWPNVRRVALLGGHIRLRDCFPNLELLILSTCEGPAITDKVSSIIPTHPALRRILVILPSWEAGDSSKSIKREVAKPHQGRVTVIDVHQDTDQGKWYEWMVGHAIRGTIWTLPGDDWLSLA